MDAVAIGAMLAVGGTLIVFIFLAIRVMNLMNSDNSED